MSATTIQNLTDNVTITISVKGTDTEPPIRIYEVELTHKDTPQKGCWCETFGSHEQLEAYITGIVAGASMIANKAIPKPMLPRKD